MPRVKIDYVVSFSSEDPEHPANNLLHWELSKKKWLCKRGEPSCSVVLQLTKAVKITSVHIGVYHAALVEVLVARSETSSEQFQVLVPSSVFISRDESRRDSAVERVRSFSADQLSAGARDQRWDRVRIVCSQPYNKHCKYGLSFVHINEPEAGSAAAVPPRLLAFDTYSSDEDEFKPGELFAKHLQKIRTADSTPTTTSNTGAQIRQATSLALKNIPETSTKLMKTPINKTNTKRDSTTTEHNADRSRDTLMYTEDDDRPHAKIDHVVQRHKDEKDRDDKNKPKGKDRDRPSDTGQNAKDDVPKKTKRTKTDSPQRDETPPSRTKNYDKTSDQKKKKEDKKRRRSNSQDKPGEASSSPHTLLRGVVLVLSGYENPQRARIRSLALAMGADVRRDWDQHCTHLICAFPNTPKLRAVRSVSADIPAVRAEWLEQCSAQRCKLPWRWYATERDQRTPARRSDTDGDTDDEIEKVLQQQKKRRLTASDVKQTHCDHPPDTSTHGNSRPDGPKESDDAGTDEEAAAADVEQFGGALPDFFDGYTFAIDAEPRDELRMRRYVCAYGGLVLDMSAVEEGSKVDYYVRGRNIASPAGTVSVTAAWLASCHAQRKLLPHRSA